MGIHDSVDLALQDWLGTAGFDRGVDDPAGEDFWARQWATAYVDFAAGEKRAWLHGMGVRWFPVVGWAERGGGLADGHGNSVPRFHVTWGTGPGLVEPFVRRVRDGGGARARRAAVPAPRRRARRSPTAWSTACTARCWSPAPRCAARRARAPRSASSPCARRP